MARAPRGFRDVSTTHQQAYVSLDGDVNVRQIGARLWEVLRRGRPAFYEKSKVAALDHAMRIVFEKKGRR